MTTSIPSTMHIAIDNLKCGGCEKTILKGLTALEGVSDVEVDHAHNAVRLRADPALRPLVAEKLRSMGYPESGSVSGMEAGLANAKSFVSCAIGRVS